MIKARVTTRRQKEKGGTEVHAKRRRSSLCAGNDAGGKNQWRNKYNLLGAMISIRFIKKSEERRRGKEVANIET